MMTNGERAAATEQVEDNVVRAGDTHFLQPKITGYRQLVEEETAMINIIKAHGTALGELIERLPNLGSGEVDMRWVAIGRTHLQEGIMALVRAVARPEGF